MTKRCADCLYHHVKSTYLAVCQHPASAGKRDSIARQEGMPCGPDGLLFHGLRSDTYETPGTISDAQKTLLFFASVGMFS